MARKCANCKFCIHFVRTLPDGKYEEADICHGGPPQLFLNQQGMHSSAFPLVDVKNNNFWCSLHRYRWGKQRQSA